MWMTTCENLALAAAAAVGCPLAGVDLLPAADGELYVLEVNAVPGWKALARTLRLDVARWCWNCWRSNVKAGD